MKKAVFFDLYGTLIDIKTDEYDPWVYSVLSQFLSYHSVRISLEELKESYFKGIEQQLRQSKESHPEADVYKVFHRVMLIHAGRRYSKGIVIDTAMLFRSLTRKHFGLFPSVLDTLTSLGKKYKVAIISDAQWVFAEPEMKMLGLDRFFKLRILSSRFGFKKPDVRLFKIAMEKLRVRPEESVYIGDDPRKDLTGSKRAGMKCVLFRSDSLPYNDFTPDGRFFDYSVLEDIIHAIFNS
jgi:putative hydrolase of the HAD superfamily